MSTALVDHHTRKCARQRAYPHIHEYHYNASIADGFEDEHTLPILAVRDQREDDYH